MNIQTLEKVDEMLEVVEKWNSYAIALVLTVIAVPFILLHEAWKYIVRKVRRMVYDETSKEWVTRAEYEKKIIRKRIENRELPLVMENHVSPDSTGCFLFFKKKKLTIPYDQLVYVETEYNEKLHCFFDENVEWLETWQRWFGWDIVEYDYEDIKEGMLYPVDFDVFKHGFLWHSPFSGIDQESGLNEETYYYYEINPDSEVSVEEQMEMMMSKVYKHIDFM